MRIALLNNALLLHGPCAPGCGGERVPRRHWGIWESVSCWGGGGGPLCVMGAADGWELHTPKVRGCLGVVSRTWTGTRRGDAV